MMETVQQREKIVSIPNSKVNMQLQLEETHCVSPQAQHIKCADLSQMPKLLLCCFLILCHMRYLQRTMPGRSAELENILHPRRQQYCECNSLVALYCKVPGARSSLALDSMIWHCVMPSHWDHFTSESSLVISRIGWYKHLSQLDLQNQLELQGNKHQTERHAPQACFSSISRI